MVGIESVGRRVRDKVFIDFVLIIFVLRENTGIFYEFWNRGGGKEVNILELI